MALKKAFKKKWIEALRSGKYRQGTRALRSDRGFCCLGVACDIIDPNGWVGPIGNDIRWTDGDKQPRSAYIPYDTAARIGISQVAMGNLASMNDSGGKSFSWIADYIEENL